VGNSGPACKSCKKQKSLKWDPMRELCYDCHRDLYLMLVEVAMKKIILKEVNEDENNSENNED